MQSKNGNIATKGAMRCVTHEVYTRTEEATLKTLIVYHLLSVYYEIVQCKIILRIKKNL